MDGGPQEWLKSKNPLNIKSTKKILSVADNQDSIQELRAGRIY